MPMTDAIADFERAFAERVGARYAIAMANGTVTLEVALRAIGVEPGEHVITTPLTMAATSIAILNVGARPVYGDVDPDSWLLAPDARAREVCVLTVSLYGLHTPPAYGARWIDDAAQTLRPHRGALFTSYSFQASKILPLGEGGMLVTDDEELASRARSIGSLGYALRADHPRIDKAALKSPSAVRHVRWPAQNARMNARTARAGLRELARADERLRTRRAAATLYADAIRDCDWLRPQAIPAGAHHDYWSFAATTEGSADIPWPAFAAAIERHGGTRPFAAWRLTYEEPAFTSLRPSAPLPTAESLQPRMLAFQTNRLQDAARNADALAKAIRELNG
jgi:perosamine synthetase